jgi:peptidoglycan hydrolase CwlO-like protein
MMDSEVIVTQKNMWEANRIVKQVDENGKKIETLGEKTMTLELTCERLINAVDRIEYKLDNLDSKVNNLDSKVNNLENDNRWIKRIGGTLLLLVISMAAKYFFLGSV